MAKLNRESRLREKRAEKQARKAARRSMAESESSQEVFSAHELDPDPVGLDPSPEVSHARA
jgi:hypothetical protein